MKNLKNILRIELSMIIVFFITFSLFGQEKTDSTIKDQSGSIRKINYGLKVGSTMSSFSTEQPHTNFKPGLIAGIFISYELSSSFDLQLEPTYIQQGGNLISIFDYHLFLVPDPPYSFELQDQRITFHNLDLPLLIKCKTSILGLKVFAVAGPSVAYNFRTENQKEVSARTNESIPVYYYFHREENISSNIKSWQYGAVGGIGFETPVGKHSLIFDLRYRYSLNKTYPGFSYLGLYQIQGDLRTNSLYFTLGFGF